VPEPTPARRPALRAAAPVPPNARGPEVPDDPGYVVQEIAPGVHWISDGVYQTMFVVTDDGVIAIDAPPTLGQRYVDAIAAVTHLPVTHVVYTHAHFDHSGAAHLFPPDAEYVAHTDTAALLARDADPARPLPTLTFDASHVLAVGGQQLDLDYHGVVHTPGSLFVHAPEHRVLMLVDVVFPGWVPFKNFGESKDLPALVGAHDRALAYDFSTLVAGHVGRLGTQDDVVEARAYLDDLRDSCARAIEAIRLEDYAAALGRGNPWHLYDAYLDGLVDHVTEDVVPRWVDRLGGADVFTDDNAYIVLQSLRLDR
jgi:glyoxylase-like metal-dependent hydrolase (beta-lactamase superfamily II)